MSYDIKADPEIDKKYILSRVSQEEIFEHYLGVEVQTYKHIRSPLRKDKHPTCNFEYYRGKLYFMDWAIFDKPKDCFNLVMYIYDLDYWNALDKIASDFDVIGKEKDDQLNFEFEASQSDAEDSSTPTLIEVKKQPFTSVDKEYLSQYNITRETCEYYKVFSIKRVWLNKDSIFSYGQNDPALGYYFGKKNGIQQWKIYFYKRDQFRFVCNTSRIQGWAQLPDGGEYCVITKSLKDVMCLYEYDIPAIAPQSENVLPERDCIKEIRRRFENLVSLYDFDRTGVSSAIRLDNEYNITSLFFTNGRFNTVDYEAKDFSDYVAGNEEQDIQEIIQSAKNYL
jgi:hypothetical protein